MSSGFPTRSDTNRAVQPPTEMDKGLKFRIYEVEGLYYLCSKNIAPLVCAFLHMQKAGFLMTQFN